MSVKNTAGSEHELVNPEYWEQEAKRTNSDAHNQAVWNVERAELLEQLHKVEGACIALSKERAETLARLEKAEAEAEKYLQNIEERQAEFSAVTIRCLNAESEMKRWHTAFASETLRSSELQAQLESMTQCAQKAEVERDDWKKAEADVKKMAPTWLEKQYWEWERGPRRQSSIVPDLQAHFEGRNVSETKTCGNCGYPTENEPLVLCDECNDAPSLNEARIRADEREACAKIAAQWPVDSAYPKEIAAAIRERGDGK